MLAQDLLDDDPELGTHILPHHPIDRGVRPDRGDQLSSDHSQGFVLIHRPMRLCPASAFLALQRETEKQSAERIAVGRNLVFEVTEPALSQSPIAIALYGGDEISII